MREFELIAWVVIFLLVCDFSMAFSITVPSLRKRSRFLTTIKLLDREDSRGIHETTGRFKHQGDGIYEYTGETRGSQPPPEIAEFLGFGAKRIASAPKKPRKKRTGPTEKEMRIARREAYKEKETPQSIEELERTILEKFGYKNSLRKLDETRYDQVKDDEEDNDDADFDSEKEESKHKRKTPTFRALLNRDAKFDPFKAAVESPTESKRTTLKTEPIKPVVPEVKEPEPIKVRKYFDLDFEKGTVLKDEDVQAKPVAEVRSGPMNALSGFRLRPPPPPNPAKVALEARKEEERLEKEKRLAEKLLDLKRIHKKSFKPFSFADPFDKDAEIANSEADMSDLFTNTTFQELGVTNPTVLQNLYNMGVDSATQIQAAAIPALNEGQNIVLQAQTGSGKTLAFLLPLLKAVDPTLKQVQAIILAPSRELAQQIGQVAMNLFEGTEYRVQTIIGGANVHHQTINLRDERPQILIATPGRLAEIVFKLEKLRLGGVRVVIVDEVDSMMSEPYVGEVETILQATPFFSRRQLDSETPFSPDERDLAAMQKDPMQRLLWLASATSQNPGVAAFADRYTARSGKGWSEISVTGGSALPDTITHGLISIGRDRAPEYLKRVLLSKPAVESALIFVNDPYKVEVVCRDLARGGIIAAPLHGEASKDDRREIVARIKDGRLKYVVTTELAARGIDIPELSHVINFELPTDAPHYVHRTGRCGRAGRKGLVINFANTDTKFVIRRFGKKLGVPIHDCEIRDGRVYLKHEE